MKSSGFTLIEIMLSLALLGIIGGVSAPLYQSFQNRNQLSVATNMAAQTMRRAQVMARATVSDTQWGVYIESGSITLFQGDDFTNRDTAFDERMDISPSISISGQQEYVFEKLTGQPAQIGSVTFSGPTNEEKEVRINNEGMINY